MLGGRPHSPDVPNSPGVPHSSFNMTASPQLIPEIRREPTPATYASRVSVWATPPPTMHRNNSLPPPRQALSRSTTAHGLGSETAQHKYGPVGSDASRFLSVHTTAMNEPQPQSAPPNQHVFYDSESAIDGQPAVAQSTLFMPHHDNVEYLKDQLKHLSELVRNLSDRVTTLESKNVVLITELAAFKSVLLGPSAPPSAIDTLVNSGDPFDLSFSHNSGLKDIADSFMSPPHMPVYDVAFARQPHGDISLESSSTASSPLHQRVSSFYQHGAVNLASPRSSISSLYEITGLSPQSTLFEASTPLKTTPESDTSQVVDLDQQRNEVEASPTEQRKAASTFLQVATEAKRSETASEAGTTKAAEDGAKTPTVQRTRDAILAGRFPLEQIIDTRCNIDEEAVVERLLNIPDQSLSIHMQARVSRAREGPVVDRVFAAVGQNVVELSMNRFGNFLVSCCLQYAPAKVVTDWAKRFKGHVHALATDHFGCHVVQKLLDHGGTAARDLVLQELCQHVDSMTNRNASHVWIRLFKKSFPLALYNRVSEAGAKGWQDVVVTETGATMVLKMLATRAELSDLRQDCLDNLHKVACCSHGSLVIAQMIQGPSNAITQKVIKLASSLVLNEYAVKVVEKALKLPHVQHQHKSPLVDYLSSEKNGTYPLVAVVSASPAGGDLVYYLMTARNAIEAKDKDKLAKAIRKNAKQLKRTGQGQRILQTV